MHIGTLVLIFMIFKVQICSWLYYYRTAASKSNKFFNFPKFFHVSGEEVSIDLKNYNKFHWFFHQKFYDNLIYMTIYNKFFLVLDKRTQFSFYILQGVTAHETKFLNEFILDKIQKKSTSGYKHPETFKKIFNDPRYKNINIASVIIIG